MNPLISLNARYLLLTLLLLLVEVVIAFYVHDNFIRPYVGDVLVVILMYTFIKTFLNIRPLTAGLAVLGIAFAIEFLQMINFIGVLGLEDSLAARLILGTSFHWADLLAYTIGVGLTLILEKRSATK